MITRAWQHCTSPLLICGRPFKHFPKHVSLRSPLSNKHLNGCLQSIFTGICLLLTVVLKLFLFCLCIFLFGSIQTCLNCHQVGSMTLAAHTYECHYVWIHVWFIDFTACCPFPLKLLNY